MNKAILVVVVLTLVIYVLTKDASIAALAIVTMFLVRMFGG